ncbi:MAG: hypothetical protein MZV63_28195 [Marinilabiliales bacterium]|nr:hypothetical protein [Marinilabiliales bacterium]
MTEPLTSSRNPLLRRNSNRASIEQITKQQYLRRITHKLKVEGKKVRFQFLSVLSHELKAPLNAIEGYLRMMQERQMGDSLDEYTSAIERSLQRIDRHAQPDHGPSRLHQSELRAAG